MPQLKILIVVLGQTAIGKTALSINLAKFFNTEIISADSRQFFKELSIGTAKPSPIDLKKVKHHFIDNLSIHDYYNVSKYETEVISLLRQLYKTHDNVLLVGGSGLYIDAVCNGVDELPDPDLKLRNNLNDIYKKQGIEVLQEKLKALDPDYFEKVDKLNPSRLIRAIEVSLITGKPYSSFRKEKVKQREFHVIKIGLARKKKELNDIINKRVDEMIRAGLVEEARKMNPHRHLNSLNTVGYKELFDYFDRKCTLDKAIENIKTNTRRYAKRQLTWFKRDLSIQWFQPEENDAIIQYIVKKSAEINKISQGK